MIFLNPDEAEKFAMYLEEHVESDDQLAEQFKKSVGPQYDAILKLFKMRKLAYLFVAKELRSMEFTSIKGGKSNEF